jgi:heptosyltransferase-2
MQPSRANWRAAKPRLPPRPLKNLRLAPVRRTGAGVVPTVIAMNIAVFLPNWIGDVVMATPALRALREHFQSAHLLGVCRPYVHEVVEGSPWFDDVIYLDRQGQWVRWPKVAWTLRQRRIDLAILFPNSFRSALVAWLGNAKRRIGFDRFCRGGLLTDRLESLRDAKGRFVPTPIIDDYNRLTQRAGCPWPGHRMELFTTPADERAADIVWDKCHLSAAKEVICINPGAAFGAAKYWQTDSFARLAQDVTGERGSHVLVLCGPKERETARQIVRLAARKTVHSLADEPLSLGLSKALVRRCDLLVTTDSGPRHFAAAFDRPVITLFGPTHIEWTDTYYAKAANLQKPVPCGPCQQRECHLDHRCMTELTPKEVFAAVNDLLARVERGLPLPVVAAVGERKAS